MPSQGPSVLLQSPQAPACQWYTWHTCMQNAHPYKNFFYLKESNAMKIPTDKRGKFKKAVKDERKDRKPNGKRKEAGRGEVSCRKDVTGGDILKFLRHNTLQYTEHWSPVYQKFMELLKEQSPTSQESAGGLGLHRCTRILGWVSPTTVEQLHPTLLTSCSCSSHMHNSNNAERSTSHLYVFVPSKSMHLVPLKESQARLWYPIIDQEVQCESGGFRPYNL